MSAYKNPKKRKFNISIGILLFLVQAFVLVKADLFFPADQIGSWRTSIIIYMVLQASMYAIPDLRNRLFNVSPKDYLVKLLVSSVLTFGILSFGLSSVVGDIFGALATLSFSSLMIIVFYHIYVASIEQPFFFWFLKDKMHFGIFGAALVFAVFHILFTTTLFIFMSYFLLALIFIFIQKQFSPKTGAVNTGVHAGYDVFKEGLIQLRSVVQ